MWSDLERQESSEAFQNLRGLEVWPQHANFEYIFLHLSTISSLIMRVDTRILANISGSHVALCRGHESSFLPLCFPIHCSQDKVEYQQAGTTLVQKKISFRDPVWQFIGRCHPFPTSVSYTLPKTNMSPEKWCLEEDPFLLK